MTFGDFMGRRTNGSASRLWGPVGSAAGFAGRLVLASVLASVLVLALSLGAVGCTGGDNAGAGGAGGAGAAGAGGAGAGGADVPAAGSVPVKVASLRGPTSMGLVDFMAKADAEAGAGDVAAGDAAAAGDVAAPGTAGDLGAAGNADLSDPLIGSYQFEICGTADEILPGLISGDIDIALLPANVASVLYNRTNGGVTAMSVNTLGALYVVSGDVGISSLEDLAGRTVLMTGKGTTPEYVMSHLLERNGLAESVTLEYKAEATELAAAIMADPTAIALLPEPYVTVVTSKNPELSVRLSLAKEWVMLEGAVPPGGGEPGQLVAGVTVVRTAFLEEHPEVVQEFLANQAASVDAVLKDPAAAAQLVVERGIIDNAQIAEKAIPMCNLVCITGSDMQVALGSYLKVLLKADPAAVGGALPGDDFYYVGPAA